MSTEAFIDYYELLEINLSANVELIETAVRAQLRRYAPQNAKTADETKFELVKKTYLALSNAKSRSSYDAEYERQNSSAPKDIQQSISTEALEDQARKRVAVLTVMYERMLEKAQDGSLTAIEISIGAGYDVVHLEFALWFLREKRYIARTDVGDLCITDEGVEWLEVTYGVNLAAAVKPLKSRVNGVAHPDTAEHPDTTEAVVEKGPEPVPNTLISSAESTVRQ